MTIYWIPEITNGRLGMMTCAQSGETMLDAVSLWKSAELDLIVSLLENEEAIQLAFTQEEAMCRSAGMELVRLPIPDQGVPASFDAVNTAVEKITTRLSQGGAVGIHCHEGTGRTGMITAAVLVRYGLSENRAWIIASRARGIVLPDTLAQCVWLSEYVDAQQQPLRDPTSH